jgi:hypothetical protein
MARDFIEALSSSPVKISEARRAEENGGIPDEPGLYAWWLASPDALPAVPAPAHRTEPGLVLLYVGVAPKDATSRERLRSRVLKRHVSSGLADSTFRRSLAALLWQEKGWTPLVTATGRFDFSPKDDAELRGWQERNLRLSWLEVDRPWESEPRAIDDLGPPFNLADNRDHPFYEEMKTARAIFKAKAEAVSPELDE